MKKLRLRKERKYDYKQVDLLLLASNLLFFLIFILILYWSTVDSQCVSFGCIAKQYGISIIFQILASNLDCHRSDVSISGSQIWPPLVFVNTVTTAMSNCYDR